METDGGPVCGLLVGAEVDEPWKMRQTSARWPPIVAVYPPFRLVGIRLASRQELQIVAVLIET